MKAGPEALKLTTTQQLQLFRLATSDGWTTTKGMHHKTVQALVDRELLLSRETKKRGPEVKISAKGKKWQKLPSGDN